MKRTVIVGALLLAVGGCTPGSFATAGPGGMAGIAQVVTIDVDLTKDPAGSTPAGTAAGYAPLVVQVAVGEGIRFTNSDGFAHTATAITGTSFPTAYPFDASALTERGSAISTGFGSGSLVPGATSQTLLADRPGTYLYGCFYHYGSPMRAEIQVH